MRKDILLNFHALQLFFRYKLKHLTPLEIYTNIKEKLVHDAPFAVLCSVYGQGSMPTEGHIRPHLALSKVKPRKNLHYIIKSFELVLNERWIMKISKKVTLLF
jgi:hypothetical protein